MNDAATRKPIRVSDHATAGPYIRLPADQIESVRRVLQDNGVPHWVEHLTISFDGKPPVGVINLGLRTDPRHVQALLDAAL